MEEADRDRLGVHRREAPQVERRDDSVRPHPLPHPVAAVERNERLRVGGAQPVEMRPRLTAELEQVLEARRGHESGAGALPLEQGVGRDRGPVREALDPDGADGARGGENRLLLAGGGRHLGRRDPAVLDEDGIGERSADVDAEEGHRTSLG